MDKDGKEIVAERVDDVEIAHGNFTFKEPVNPTVPPI